MTAPNIEDIVSRCQATDMRLARVANGVEEAIAATERALSKPRAAYIERHVAPPTWWQRHGETVLSWLTAIGLGVGLGYLAGKGF